uniref:SVWC domain-containing protein n=1 Tax=Glossina pallidipes TaxID=7398 RepID=A0A1A9ZBI2_GLOPL
MKQSLTLLLLISTLLIFKPETCYGDCEVYGLVLKKGEAKTVPGKCSQVVCVGNRYDEYEIENCPNAYSPKDCTFVPVDLTKIYPKCCPHWKCADTR